MAPRWCKQELCPMWDGEGCPCDLLGLDPDDLPTDGVFTVTWEEKDARWKRSSTP